MIKKLRRKFLLIAMGSVILVLGSIIAFINVMNYSRVNDSSERVLSVLIENEGEFPPMYPTQPENGNGITPETPFTSRYFTVVIDENGNAVQTDVSKIAGISEETAQDYAELLAAQGSTSGMYDDFKYGATSVEGGTMYVFLDCEKDMFIFRNFLNLSVTISVCALLVIFILVFILSKMILKPVEESYRRQKSFITNASHDIKTPLTIIGAQTDVIELETGKSEWTDEIKAQIGRLSALTDKLVFLSKMEEDKYQPEFAEFSLTDAVFEMTQAYAGVARERGFTFDCEIAENLRYVGNEDMIKQAIALIMDNAIKYTNENGKIAIRLKQNGKNVLLSFYNTVEEIAQGKHDEIFDRFYRVDRSRNSKTGGNGIGLSVVKAIVTMHKGNVSAYSEDGKSIQINLTL